MLNKLTLTQRASLGYGSVIAIGIGIATYGALQMRALSGHLEELAENRMVKVGQLTEFKDNLQNIGRFARDIVIHNTPSFASGELQKIAALRTRNSTLLDALDKTIALPKGRELLKTIQDSGSSYDAALDRAIQLATQGDTSTAGAQLVGDVQRIQHVLFQAADDSVAMQEGIAHNLAENGHQASATGLAVMSALGALMAVIGTAVGWLVTRAITRPLAGALKAVEAIRDGDLTSAVPVGGSDEIGKLLCAMVAMQRSLGKVVADVRTNADSVATASAQIAEGNHDLSQRTAQQASAQQQTAATMEELGATVRNNAESALQANQLARGASAVAVQGGEVVGQVVRTMQGISESSRRIGEIIGVIDGIAFQTNILALNAAVEAARAGEQGRGFAVVASEVRSLAQRSSEAAKEIKTLIGRSVQQVEQGGRLVDLAGQTMGGIVASIQRVSDIVAEITAASAEQSTGISQVGDAVSQMDQVTQQNAALVEESAAAADSLRQQARQLVSAVAVFKLADGRTPAVTVPAAVAVAVAAAQPALTATSDAGRATLAVRPRVPPALQPAHRPNSVKSVSAASADGDWAAF